MDQKIVALKAFPLQETFRNEWRLQIDSLEKSIAFLDMYLDRALKQMPSASELRDPQLAFCRTETPLIMQESREALRLLRLLSDPASYDDY